MKPDGRVGQLLLMVDQAYDRTSWHGTNLRGSIRRVSATEAAWRPAPDRHNIWELVVHAAYWKYAVWRRLASERRGSFPLKGSNWFRRPEVLSEAAWRADIALLDQTHESLREAIERLSARDLHRSRGASTVSNLAVISGIAAHDLYHAGQIQLLKKLARIIHERSDRIGPFAEKTVGAGRSTRTKNAAQAASSESVTLRRLHTRP